LFKSYCLQKLFGYLRLARPANIITAFADILAGVAIAFYTTQFQSSYLLPVGLLLLSTLGLYGGGVVMNDVFDAALDAEERPERPIPSGLIPKKSAALWGIGLLTLGVVAAGLVHWPHFFSLSFWLALLIAFAALLYDAWGKHQNIFGPINMGICRGLNLLLGISIVSNGAMVHQYWYLALVPIVFIAAITMISRGEVHGGKKSTLYAAAIFYAVVLLTIVGVAFWNKTTLTTIPFLVLFAAMVYPPLLKAIKNPIGPNIGKAVKAGVLSLILMNAAWAAAFAAPVLALGMLLLLPLSLLVAKAFAVT
jgi:hypothetical protein